MKEEVKYVYQEGPLLVAEKKGSSVYQETTVSSNRGRTAQFYEQYCTAHLCSRLRLVLSVLALATCVTVIIVSRLVLLFRFHRLFRKKNCFLFNIHGFMMFPSFPSFEKYPLL